MEQYDIIHKLERVGENILETSRSELYLNMRFLAMAFGGFKYAASDHRHGRVLYILLANVFNRKIQVRFKMDKQGISSYDFSLYIPPPVIKGKQAEGALEYSLRYYGGVYYRLIKL